MTLTPLFPQTPAQAGVHRPIFPHALSLEAQSWIPAFAGIGGDSITKTLNT